MKSDWSPGLPAQPLVVGGHHRAPRNSGSWNKASRFVLNLSDAQIVELVRQVSRLVAGSADIHPDALRMTIASFLRRPPKC